MRYMADVAWEDIVCAFSRELAADPSLDITDEILEGLNAAYVKSKSEK